MKRNALIGTIAAAVLAVGGIGVGVGASIAATQDSADPTPNVTVSETPTAEPTAEPLVASTPEPTAVVDVDAAFLAYVREAVLPTTGIGDASDASLIAAGHSACEQIAAGVKLEDLRMVEGEEPHPSGAYYDSSAIFNGALVNYCPELMETYPTESAG